jgi:hypothetical protein
MMMWKTTQVMKWLEKWGTGQTKQLFIPEHPGYSPKIKSLQDLSIKFKAIVTKEVVDDAGVVSLNPPMGVDRQHESQKA